MKWHLKIKVSIKLTFKLKKKKQIFSNLQAKYYEFRHWIRIELFFKKLFQPAFKKEEIIE